MKLKKLQIATISNVPIILSIDWFLFVIGYILITALHANPLTILNTALAILAISGIVLLHELGHMFMAKHYGAKTDSITLHCFGGLAAINPNGWRKLLNKPKQSFLVWLAGPAVNIVLFALTLPLARFLYHHHHLILWNYCFYLLNINFVLAAFNLLPVFPMDGGGMFYSVLRMISSKKTAITITSVVGVIGSLAFVALAIKLKAIMLGVIGLFTLMSCLTAVKHPLFK